MDHLWAPWRQAYLAAARPSTEGDTCFICKAWQAREDRSNLVVLRKRHCLVMLNRFPYNNGHLLIAPHLHKGTFQGLLAAEWVELMETLQAMTALLDEVMRPAAYNIGLNLGAAAGAGLPGHLHWHVVPRWYGDTNFMPVLADTKVMGQSLDSLFDLLTEQLKGASS